MKKRVSDVVQNVVQEVVAEQSDAIDDSQARSIGTTVAGDPRLIRAAPDSEKSIDATVDVVDETVERAGLESFGVSRPNRLRSTIVEGTRANLYEEQGLDIPRDTSVVDSPGAARSERLATCANLKQNVGSVVTKEETRQDDKSKSFQRLLKHFLSYLRKSSPEDSEVTVENLLNKSDYGLKRSPHQRLFTIKSYDNEDRLFVSPDLPGHIVDERILDGDLEIEVDGQGPQEELPILLLGMFNYYKSEYESRISEAKEADELEGSAEFREAMINQMKAETAAKDLAIHQQAQALGYVSKLQSKYSDYFDPEVLMLVNGTLMDSMECSIHRRGSCVFESDNDWAYLKSSSLPEPSVWQDIEPSLEMVWDHIVPPFPSVDMKQLELPAMDSGSESESL